MGPHPHAPSWRLHWLPAAQPEGVASGSHGSSGCTVPSPQIATGMVEDDVEVVDELDVETTVTDVVVGSASQRHDVATQCAPAPQPVVPSHSSSLPESIVPSPQEERSARMAAAFCFLAESFPSSTSQAGHAIFAASFTLRSSPHCGHFARAVVAVFLALALPAGASHTPGRVNRPPSRTTAETVIGPLGAVSWPPCTTRKRPSAHGSGLTRAALPPAGSV